MLVSVVGLTDGVPSASRVSLGRQAFPTDNSRPGPSQARIHHTFSQRDLFEPDSLRTVGRSSFLVLIEQELLVFVEELLEERFFGIGVHLVANHVEPLLEL